MTVVTEYVSGLVRTKVLTGGQAGGFTWIRSPEAPRSDPLEAPSGALRLALEACTPSPSGRGPGARCALPGAHGAELRYELPGRSSLAELLLSDGIAEASRDLAGAEDVLYDFGLLLRALHAASPTAAGKDGVRAQPAAWHTLRSWIGTPTADGVGQQLHRLLRELLGTSCWHRVERWLRELPASGPGVLVHGAPRLALLVPAEGPDVPHGLITGEDVAVAPWQWDVGWVLAELRELRFFAARLHSPGVAWDRLEQAFVDGYGRPEDPLVRCCVVLRSLLHLHDFCAFVAWDAAEVRRYATLITHFMAEEEGTP
ncbi:hypothetical protein [Streptomyces sp. NPDC014734]|uniref:hypothetical protein n=1 Tax=Streptomyces sp. NPDC014734 TaxID=3364886 RepID=UPI0036FB39AC